jgi:hypothetical protein
MVNGCMRVSGVADGPNWKRTGIFAAPLGRVDPTLKSAELGEKVVVLKGAEDTKIRLLTPIVLAALLAP